MAVMESYLPSKVEELYDPIRQKWMVVTPEEIVRQKFIAYLIESRLFPEEVIAVEKKLSELPFVKEQKNKVPDRRLDILCFGPQLSYPLFLIECKAIPLSEKMLSQVWGYNAFIQAPFIALVNEKEIIMGREEKGERRYDDFVPKYQNLIEEYDVCKDLLKKT